MRWRGSGKPNMLSSGSKFKIFSQLTYGLIHAVLEFDVLAVVSMSNACWTIINVVIFPFVLLFVV